MLNRFLCNVSKSFLYLMASFHGLHARLANGPDEASVKRKLAFEQRKYFERLQKCLLKNVVLCSFPASSKRST